MHRRLKPLLWLVLMLAVVFLGTFAAGGIVLGEVSAMGIGFAAILIGLAVDYGVVLYRERGAGNGSAKTLRKQIGPSILWAAATTAVVFCVDEFQQPLGNSRTRNVGWVGNWDRSDCDALDVHPDDCGGSE